ncbi:hypothetical protein GCM10017778_55880 [Streptomyces vinaceus]|nr:hypothetical protein GCM10017778_55880 [Streptomyces vinaceus]
MTAAAIGQRLSVRGPPFGPGSCGLERSVSDERFPLTAEPLPGAAAVQIACAVRVVRLRA